ncbi:DUF7288 family protein [Halostagnicola kamekurae]|uniref:Uncharacterized protein n=1 Tax=Halostagnicola kamekurae TaxID=619731 RepID=A0A1I6SFY4_9EURY|nr:hypothetical protein [Halostagnicola kamekurae]SFS75834.1 hypothetical protein SAMN04488556_2642 [Halostagnicola kamekurae]
MGVRDASVRSRSGPCGGHESSRDETDRGQAYTLEGVVGAAIVLAAVLVASQTGGLTAATEESKQRHRQHELERQAQEALLVAATARSDGGDLSALVRAWDGTAFSSGELETFVLGELLAEQFGESSRNEAYRIRFAYERHDGSIARETVYSSADAEPGPDAAAASYTETVAAAANESDPPAMSDREVGPIAAVVDVEVTVW